MTVSTAAGDTPPRIEGSPLHRPHTARLPVPLGRLIGREDDLAAVMRRITQSRVLTLTGAGGTGKTVLALQAAANLRDRFTDGVLFVSLAAITDPLLVLPAMARALGVTEGGDQPLAEIIAQAVRARHLLLILDNFEQVIAAAPHVAAVLADCPGLHMLVTSREPLRIAGEREYPVPPLALPDARPSPNLDALAQVPAVALFVERAQAVKPDFALTAAVAAPVAAICTRLDGLPLAIELAGARIKVLSPQALLDRLENRLALLTGGGRDLPARQQTLRATIDWSYALLDVHEQSLFARLGIFVGGYALEAVEAVCAADGGPPAAVLDAVASLVDKSMIRQLDGAGDEPRFGMLETLREYAVERLSVSGEYDAIARAHAAYYLTLAEAADRALTGVEQLRWLSRLDQEHDNLRAALGWALRAGESDIALRLCAALGYFWNLHGDFREGRRWIDQALALADDDRSVLRARVLDAVGFLIQTQGDYDTARTFHQASLAIMRQWNDRAGIARCLHHLAVAAQYQGDYAAARPLHDECLAIMQELDDRAGVAAVLNSLGAIAHEQGDYAAARALFEESIANARAAGDVIGQAAPVGNLGLLCIEINDDDAARHYLTECLALIEQPRYTARHGIAECLEGLAVIFGRQGGAMHAMRLAGAAAALREAIGVPLAPAARDRYEQALGGIRARSDGDEWEAARAEGWAMSVEQAIAYVRAAPPLSRTIVAPSPAAYPAGLSAREVEVLRLVAAGLTNAQVAERLFLSPRTINAHLTTIYGKLDVPSRAAAIRFALDHGLI